MFTNHFRVIALATIVGATGSAYGVVLNAHPGPANNGGSTGWAIFFNLTAGASALNITGMQSASTAAANATFSVEVLTRPGTALGGPVGSGPGSSTAGWTSLGSVTATQGAVASQTSLMIDTPDFVVGAGSTVGVAVRFTGVGPRYVTGTVLTNYNDANLTITTGDVRSTPFLPSGSYFSPRLMVGSIEYNVVPEPASMLVLVGGLGILARRRRRA